MNQIIKSRNKEVSFKDFLFKEKQNKNLLILSAIAIIVQFIVFKYLYPFANFIHGDSFSYIKAATGNLTINTYPIGYSKFLRLFNVFTKPDIVLVAFQYLFVQSSTLFLLFTIFYYYNPGRIAQYVLVVIMVVNPMLIHLANLVSSDCYFLSISMIWIALLIWIINRPSNKLIIWHAVILLMAFTTRYNALIYPVLSLLVFWISSISLQKKLLGMGLALVLCGWFAGLTMYQYKKLTGFWQFSPFSGWQLANNAMYSYRDVDPSLYRPVPKKFQALDSAIRKFYKNTKDLNLNPYEKAQASTFYMWTPSMPLMKYQDSLFKNTKDSAAKFKKWASMGPFYKEYGLYIIRKYPFHYLKYFAAPNTRKYFAPPVEFLQNYNSGEKFVTPETVKWFGYDSKNINTRMKSSKTWVLDFVPILSGTVNCLLFFGLLYYILLKGWLVDAGFNKLVLLGSLLWLSNAFFTIFASSAALRFQSFPILLNTTFAVLIIDWMGQLFLTVKMEKAGLRDSKSILGQEVIAQV